MSRIRPELVSNSPRIMVGKDQDGIREESGLDQGRIREKSGTNQGRIRQESGKNQEKKKANLEEIGPF